MFNMVKKDLLFHSNTSSVLHLVLWYLISTLFNRANSLNIEIKLTKYKVGDLISTKTDLISSMI